MNDDEDLINYLEILKWYKSVYLDEINKINEVLKYYKFFDSVSEAILPSYINELSRDENEELYREQYYRIIRLKREVIKILDEMMDVREECLNRRIYNIDL